MKLKKTLVVVTLFLFVFVLVGCPELINENDFDDNDQTNENGEGVEEVDEKEIVFLDSGLDYSETLDSFHNPERGFYRAMEANLSKSSPNSLWNEGMVQSYLDEFNLFHLRIGLEEFSTNAGGQDGMIAPTALKSLENTLEVFRKHNTNVIVRFSYNRKGLSNSNGYLNAEPDLSLILIHVNQLGKILAEYYDIIAAVETGMFGPWGEQHSTIVGDSSNSLNYFKLVEAWLNVLPEGICVTVRRPLYYIYWANHKYSFDLTNDNLGEFKFSDFPQYPALKRVGVYNDGYLGSESDLGTYRNREAEIKWLSTQTKYTLFGGEVVADKRTGAIGSYNNVIFLETEALLTHTSYLNYFWNYTAVISNWENNIYSGSNELYNGKTTEFTYVANHLGYRFVLKESLLGNAYIDYNKLFLQGKIENVGFGNIVNEKNVEIILVGSSDILYFAVDYDVREIYSQSVSEYSFELDLPEGLESGEYKVYIKISDIHELTKSALRTIRFANNSSYWSAELGANLIGKINI